MCDIAKSLVGKTITGFKLADDGEEIEFTIEGDKPVKLSAEGDCCSHSWIESMDNEEALLGKVSAVENIDMPNLGNIGGKRHKDVDQVQYYGLKITTDKGVCVLDYRNDSNGYYGGYLEVVKQCK